MSRYRSRSRSSYQERYEYVYELSSSDSESEHIRGRSSYRYSDRIETPSPPSGYKKSINKAFASFFESDNMFEATTHLDNGDWPARYPNPFGAQRASYGTAHFDYDKWNGKKNAQMHITKDKHTKDKDKAKHKKPKDDSDDDIQKEKQKLKKKLKELENQEERRQKDKQVVVRREVLDVDLEIAMCNKQLSALQGWRRGTGGRRSTSQTAVRFDSFEDVFKIRDRS